MNEVYTKDFTFHTIKHRWLVSIGWWTHGDTVVLDNYQVGNTQVWSLDIGKLMIVVYRW